MADHGLSITLHGSPYGLTPDGIRAAGEALHDLESRMLAMRSEARLTDETLKRYYGDRRFEQVAESNAIEGSTLSVGETKLAVVKGMTLTGHDPGYVRDAIALDKALARVFELAQSPSSTDIDQVKCIYALIMGERPGSGAFRTTPVRISGSQHRPPRTWQEIMDAMEGWERWSSDRSDAPGPLRASVLHAWLAHIHPFADGNGRTARAISTLEMIRAGYPPPIVRRRQDRARYIDALQESDIGGDIGPFLDLMFERTEAALVGLENAAREKQGYSPQAARLRQAQERKVAVWNKSVELLYQVMVDKLTETAQELNGTVNPEVFSESLGLDEYIELCQGRAIPRGWAFRVRLKVPGLEPVERLAWLGYRSRDLREAVGKPEPSPSLFWSKRNRDGYPPWIRVEEESPGLRELSITPSEGDEWHALTSQGQYHTLSTLEAARAIATGFIDLAT